MRRALSCLLAAALLAALPVVARASGDNQVEPAPVFAVGGTVVSNGIFFPGTAVYDGDEGYYGQPYKLERGQDIMFTNLDNGEIANAHQIRSFKRNKKSGRPLFQSKRLEQPGAQSLVLVAHLKPGVYDYFCPIHTGMYGQIEIPPR